MNKKAIIGSIIALVIVVVGTLGYHNQMEDKLNDNTVKIGAILPLTGKYADAGNSVMAGLEITINELNKREKNNKVYKIEYFDNSSEVKNSITGYSKLKTNPEISCFITTLTDHSLAIKPLAIKDKKILFSISSSPEIIKNNNNLIFRPSNSSVEEVDFIVNYLQKSFKSPKIAVYTQNTEAGHIFETSFRNKFKNDVLKWIKYDDNLNALKNIASYEELNNVNSIVIFGYSASMGNLIRTIREFGYAGEIICNAGFYNPSVLAAAGSAAIGVRYLDYDFPYGSKGDIEKNEFSRENYNASFNLVSYCALGALKIFDMNIHSHMYDPEIVGDKLSVLKKYTFGDIVFTTTPEGAIKPNFKIITYEGK